MPSSNDFLIQALQELSDEEVGKLPVKSGVEQQDSRKRVNVIAKRALRQTTPSAVYCVRKQIAYIAAALIFIFVFLLTWVCRLLKNKKKFVG